jgi:hypothetical protein
LNIGQARKGENRMSDQTPNPNQIPSPNPPPESSPAGSTPPPQSYQDWREQRRAARWAHREARWQRHAGRHTGWFAGVLMILLGVILLLDQLHIPFLTNWWALFILIPAFWSFIAAWDAFKDAGRLTRRAGGPLAAGILLTLLALIFLFNLTVGIFWPALLILGGLALLGSALFPE